MDPKFDLCDNYGLVVYSAIFCAMYNAFMPWGCVVALVSQIILYYVMKVILIFIIYIKIM